MADAVTEHQAREHALSALGASAIYRLSPGLAAVIAFLAGASLLLSAAEPRLVASLRLIQHAAPLSIVEASHFIASIVGTLLVLLSIGLWQRLQPSWVAAVTVLPLGVGAAISFGAHYWYAAALSLALFLLVPLRKAFDRPTALRDMRLTPMLLIALVLFFAALIWFGLWNFRNIAYRNDLWWTFALDGQASRFLRSVVTTFIVLMLALAWWALSPPKSPPKAVLTPALRMRLSQILGNADFAYADANLSYLGDKRFIFSNSGESFLMYGVQGSNWILMGAPAGRKAEILEILWKFLELCDSYRARPVIYSFRADLLPIMLELGLTVRKIGEGAVLPLSDFSLEGRKRAKLRQAKRRLEKEGYSFAVLSKEETSRNLMALEQISNSWLKSGHGREKGFSLGFFDREYIASFETAVIQRGGKIIAFANLWTSRVDGVLSIDLMRHSVDAPNGAMDYLFTELALWGRRQGYRKLDLGMSPLAGLENRKLAPLISQLGAAVFDSGESLYGFSGLRRYKQKFEPVWEPLYIAARGELGTGLGLVNVGLLTSGGIMGMIQ